MIMFSSAAFRQIMASHPEFMKMMGSDPPATEQLIAGGWGYALSTPAAYKRTTARV